MPAWQWNRCTLMVKTLALMRKRWNCIDGNAEVRSGGTDVEVIR